MSGWYLQKVSIEGFRGINNEGAPLVLKLKPDCVNSISAPNGVGKTSIFDAVVYAITGRIPKLDDLPATEKGSCYYLNRFHAGGVGTIILTLVPANGGTAVDVTVRRDAAGARTVVASTGADGNAILADLNREFVLLDGKTFQDFIDLAPQRRGRSFAGLLGLKRYSSLRQGLASLANTKAFNNHFAVGGKEAKQNSAHVRLQRARTNVKEAFAALVGDEYDPAEAEATMLAKAHSALSGIELLKPLCEGRTFEEIDPSKCIDAAKSAEGGEARAELTKILRDEARWSEALKAAPSEEDAKRLVELADARDTALKLTQGDLFRQLYGVSEIILADDSWGDKCVCPTCDRSDTGSVLDHVRQKNAAFEAVEAASANLTQEWTEKGWNQLDELERLGRQAEERAQLAEARDVGLKGAVEGARARAVVQWLKTLTDRAVAKVKVLTHDKVALEKSLPDKLTAVVEKAEAARRLQSNLSDLRAALSEQSAIAAELARIARAKTFLDAASSCFAGAESAASARRLAAIEPVTRKIFAAIMYTDVVPALKKRAGSEDLSISLAQFWTLPDISAQAVLSESYRNAFAISVYLAAASLYGGGARFLILDDVTSSFDSGHQFHLMNVIKGQFARPGVPDGPQVILLSHDTVLEKLFNTNAKDGGWWHQCIQGTARTSVLPQSGAIHRVRDATRALLDAGNTDDAAPRIRQYLEFKLEEVISRVGIPVPIAIAFNDDKHMAKNLIDAIKAAVDLHDAAGRLVLEPAQLAGLGTSVATIVSNYLAHWSTGQTHAFTAPSLKGVMQAIEKFAACFQFEHPAGSGRYRYYRSLGQRT
ncbi:AAA domain-containing protein [Bradyrhizobium macuxiense]|uniref:AAA domain-containing protein n=1 Tax=Bradyrhizobium macuxiense TaxID=1755647 RepID=A0A560LII0_9BRAD|nr:AAA family ATPase [Bradyrhizobium macuxiense]TWB93070.1 AAA domain-containing protein [Bradyrhizobium macuxiense]